MGIDPMTFFAQIINLFVLIWILKRFLYHPILDIITKRQSEIDQENELISLKSKETEKIYLDLKKEKESFDSFEQKKRSELANEIKKEKTKELALLKDQMQKIKEKSLKAINDEEKQLKEETLHIICQDFLKVSEKILATFTKETPIDKILDLFIEKCSSLTKEEKTNINNIIKDQKLIFVNSSKELTNNQQNKISCFLKKEFIFPKKCQIKFQQKQDLIFGIELRLDSMVLDWTIQNYFDELEENINSSLILNETKEQ